MTTKLNARVKVEQHDDGFFYIVFPASLWEKMESLGWRDGDELDGNVKDGAVFLINRKLDAKNHKA